MPNSYMLEITDESGKVKYLSQFVESVSLAGSRSISGRTEIPQEKEIVILRRQDKHSPLLANRLARGDSMNVLIKIYEGPPTVGKLSMTIFLKNANISSQHLFGKPPKSLEQIAFVYTEMEIDRSYSRPDYSVYDY